MKHGDLVKVKDKLCVALKVSKKDISNGIDVLKPGLYLFRGYWYGNDPFDRDSYGKIEGKVGKVVGTAKTDRQIKKLKI